MDGVSCLCLWWCFLRLAGLSVTLYGLAWQGTSYAVMHIGGRWWRVMVGPLDSIIHSGWSPPLGVALPPGWLELDPGSKLGCTTTLLDASGLSLEGATFAVILVWLDMVAGGRGDGG